MPNIVVRRGNAGQQLQSPSEWNPFRVMRDVMHWDPFGEMAPLAQGPAVTATFLPDFEVKETKDAYEFTADVPGIKDKDIEITSTGNRLTVSGKRDAEKQENSETYFLYERSYGSFTRSFTLPDDIDIEHIKAELQDGVLAIAVPKKPEALPRKITVQVSAKAKS